MTEQPGLTGIPALEAEMQDRLAAKDAEIKRLEQTLSEITSRATVGMTYSTAEAKHSFLIKIQEICLKAGFNSLGGKLSNHLSNKSGNTEQTLTLRDLARKAESTYRCSCDLDNWEPNQDTGHSNVCRIDSAARRWKRDGLPSDF